MKAAITRLITAGAVALVLITAACIGPLPTDPTGNKLPQPTVPGDPLDDIRKS